MGNGLKKPMRTGTLAQEDLAPADQRRTGTAFPELTCRSTGGLQINRAGAGLPGAERWDLPRLEQLLELLWRDGVEAIVADPGDLRHRAAAPGPGRAAAGAGPAPTRPLPAAGPIWLWRPIWRNAPFLAEARRGAHPREHLASPSLEALEERIGGFETEIALVTLAPELEGAAAVIGRLRELGISVALGISAATAAQQAVARHGRTGQHRVRSGGGHAHPRLQCHAGLAPPGTGPSWGSLQARRGALGLIADGVHVHPTMAVLLQRLAPEQTVLVSDGSAGPLRPGRREHRWDERVLLVENGTCRLEDGTLAAGVTLPQLAGGETAAAPALE